MSVTKSLLTIEKPIIVNRPEYKFETLLFLPTNPMRKGEGGLRTKSYFKHSYKLSESDSESKEKIWYICDTEGNLVGPAPEDIQKKIWDYINNNGFQEKNITELPLVTVVTVVFNGEKYLEQTIKSVINQTYPNVEYIIIDGGSTDGTLDIIKKYEDDIDYWISENDKGIADAFNKAITLSTGNLVGILNSDDWYEKEAIYNVVISYNNKKAVGVFHGDMTYFEGDRCLFTVKPHPVSLKKMYKKMIINHPTCFVSKIIYQKYGLFDLRYKIAIDYELMLRFILKDVKFFYIPYVITNMRFGGLSDTKRINGLREAYRISIDYGYPAYKAFFNFIIKYVKAKIISYLGISNFLLQIYRSFSSRKIVSKKNFK